MFFVCCPHYGTGASDSRRLSSRYLYKILQMCAKVVELVATAISLVYYYYYFFAPEYIASQCVDNGLPSVINMLVIFSTP